MDINFENITFEMPIIGFTGALGSGCSFLAEGLANQYNFAYYSLSKPIHEEVKRRGMKKTSKNLQDIGNELRKNNGLDYLVEVVLRKAEEEMLPPRSEGRKQGLIIDGIRNFGEIGALRHFTHFYLISVQAAQKIRKERRMRGNLYKNESEFFEADRRDAEEPTRFGQQVKLCNYFADIIISNEDNFSHDAKQKIRKYIRDKLYDKYITLIMCLASGKPTIEHHPTQDEALMTSAYVESKRSSCLKRKVGAVIATASGEVITTGHNDVPEGTKSCLDDPDYKWCARDVIQEKLGKNLKHCPNCGEKIKIKNNCVVCGEKIVEFMIRCPNCKDNLDLEYICVKCKTNVFREYLPGRKPETGKLLDLCRSLHAEEKAILNLSMNGISLPEESIIYTTTFPCNLCANKIVSAGIKIVVYAEPYIAEEAIKLFDKNQVIHKRFEGVKSGAYFRLYL